MDYREVTQMPTRSMLDGHAAFVEVVANTVTSRLHNFSR